MIADVDMVVIALLLFAYVMLFAMAMERSYFAILAGLFGVGLAIEIYTVTSSVIASVAWASIAIFTILLGVVGTMREMRV
jgi:hypothetical protein